MHAIDPAGLFTTSLSASFIVKDMGPLAMARVPAQRNAANAVRIDNLRVLPDHTGGRLVTNTNDPAEMLPAVLEESQSYYLLGFEPAAPPDGDFHRIEVRVNRPGVTVQGRRWYTTGESGAAGDLTAAWRDAGPPDLTDALRAPVPRSDLPLRLNVTPLLAETAGTSPVAVLLGATLPSAPGARRLAAVVAAFDARGRAIVVHNQTPGALTFGRSTPAD